MTDADVEQTPTLALEETPEVPAEKRKLSRAALLER